MDIKNNPAPENALKAKTKLKGKVVKITLAGAIIDLGNDLPGVIHISQLKNEPVNRVEDVLQLGEEVEVWVRRIRDDRIELTMIEPFALEWRELKNDMVVKGKVTRIEPYGAFVEIGAERPGLVHVSEIAHGYVKSPSDFLHEGDEVEAVILEVNRRKKQIRLSIKANLPKPEEIQNEVQSESPKPAAKRSRKSKPSNEFVNPEEPKEPDQTVFEIAWQQALQKAENKKGDKSKRSKSSSKTQDEILNRTLESRLPTG
jgi:small subunit ribosomal protein S1